MHEHLVVDRIDTSTTVYVDQASLHLNKNIPTNAVIAFSPTQLAGLADNKKNIGIFFWTPSKALATMIESTPTSAVPTFQTEFLPATIETLPSLFQDILTQTIAAELTAAIVSLQQITGATRMRLSVGTTKMRMCPLFHVDRVHMRMIVTLKGPGTEWLADADVNRNGLSKLDNSKVVRKFAVLQQVARYQVAFLKGKLFSGGNNLGIVHRSPAVESDENARWFVKVDVLDVDRTK